jgi:hypothetical protein
MAVLSANAPAHPTSQRGEQDRLPQGRLPQWRAGGIGESWSSEVQFKNLTGCQLKVESPTGARRRKTCDLRLSPGNDFHFQGQVKDKPPGQASGNFSGRPIKVRTLALPDAIPLIVFPCPFARK